MCQCFRLSLTPALDRRGSRPGGNAPMICQQLPRFFNGYADHFRGQFQLRIGLFSAAPPARIELATLALGKLSRREPLRLVGQQNRSSFRGLLRCLDLC
jgi:hypothetical protein